MKKFLGSPKFAWGLVGVGLGFMLLVIPAKAAATPGVLVSPLWLTSVYLVHTVAELLLSPVGLSSMTKLAPRGYVGQMMGVWFMAAALGNLIAGLVGGNIDPEKLELMPQLFNRTALSMFGFAALFAVLIVPIRNMMRNTTLKEH